MTYKDIQGWMNFEDVYDHIIYKLVPGSKIVEIGIWKGKSTFYLCNLIKKSNKDITVDAIDHFKGSSFERDNYHKCAYKQDIESIAIENLREFWETSYNKSPFTRNGNMLKIISKDSKAASTLYDENSLDLVFIDGGHSYEEVSSDIKHWISKVKSGGFIGGHDYNSKEHPGVTRAVNKLLPNAKPIGSNCWLYELK